MSTKDSQATSRIQRIVVLLTTGGLAASLIWIPALVSANAEPSEWVGLAYFFLIGVVVSTIIGLPLLFAVDSFLATRWRYVIGGAIYGLVFWILMDAPVFPKDWHLLAHSRFWVEYAPRRVAIWTAFGALVGVIYSGVLWILCVVNARRSMGS